MHSWPGSGSIPKIKRRAAAFAFLPIVNASLPEWRCRFFSTTRILGNHRSRHCHIRSSPPRILLVQPATTFFLFVLTALAEIVGCYLPYLWLRKEASAWLLLPAAISLALFAWLLTLHPFAAGRTYAAYGGIYVSVALVWLWRVEGIPPDRWDLIGAAVAMAGMAIILFAPRGLHCSFTPLSVPPSASPCRSQSGISHRS